MTLGRLIELYQAEQQGKQIMERDRYYGICERIKEIKLTDCELSTLVSGINECDNNCNFFIKDEEDKYGHKLS